MKSAKELKELYERGYNISEILRKEKGIDYNTPEIIEISYDLQTGSYIEAMRDEKESKFRDNYSNEISKRILSLCNPSSILEAGIGEATTFSGVLKRLGNIKGYGFDLSWSRVAYARKWLKDNGIKDTTLCTGNLFNIPFLDNSIDVVYTSHSIEPNGGSEREILKELYRVTRKYLILLEPGYEFASDEAKKRMEFHGYCKDLKNISLSLGFEVLEHKLFPYSSNPLNPTAITIIRKDSDNQVPNNPLASPKSKTPLKEIDGMLYSPDDLVVYPVLNGIPCLRIENAIFASKYEEVINGEYK